MKRVAIIGGGISGLSAAFTLEQYRLHGSDVKYTIYEASSRFGGVLLTDRVDDCIVEAGPDSFLTEKPWAAELCEKVNLANELVGSNDSGRKTYIVLHRRLIPLPEGLMFMVPTNFPAVALSPLFSLAAKIRMAKELLLAPRQAETDESVADFITRHYGAEMVDRLGDPLLSGIYGGMASDLSVRAVLPRMVEMEAKCGSLGRGMIGVQQRQDKTKISRSVFTTIKSGMQALVDVVVSRLEPGSLRANTAVRRIQHAASGWAVSSDEQTDDFDELIIATPTHIAADLTQRLSAELAAELSGIPYSSSLTVGLVYGPGVRAALPSGFGYLIPRSEGLKTLAVTFVHNKFPHRAPENRALLRCFVGGTGNAGALDLSDDRIIEVVRSELRQVLGITDEPRVARVYRWRLAMAQYCVGHLDRLERIDRLAAGIGGLHLAGNGYRGIGIPDCVRSGTVAAEATLAV